MYAIRSYYAMNVPFMDLTSLHEPIKDEINKAIQQVLESCAFAGGPFVEKFEKEFAPFCHCEYAIGVRITSYNVCYTKLLRK